MVFVGGGMGAISRVGELLEEFISAEEAHLAAEAVKRVFDQHGNRRNRRHARIRFLIEDIGLPRFRELYAAELQALRTSGSVKLNVRPIAPQPPSSSGRGACGEGIPAADFEPWLKRYAEPQRQGGYFLVHIPLFLGDIEADRFEQLAVVVAEYGEGVLRTTQQQNLVLRWIHENELAHGACAVEGPWAGWHGIAPFLEHDRMRRRIDLPIGDLPLAELPRRFAASSRPTARTLKGSMR